MNFINESTVNRIKITLKFIGRELPENDGKNNGYISKKCILITLLNLVGLLNSIWQCYISRDHLSQKTESVMNIIVFLFSLIAIIDIIIHPDRHIIMLNIIDRQMYFNCKTNLHLKHLEEYKNAEKRQKVAHCFFLLTPVLWCVQSIFYTLETLKLLNESKDICEINTDHFKMAIISLPINKLIKLKYELMFVYIIISIVQLYFLFNTLIISTTWCFIITCCIKNIETNIKILRLSIRVTNDGRLTINEHMNNNYFNEKLLYDELKYLKYLIQQHQNIISNVKQLNEFSEVIMLVLNNVMTLLLASKLYFSLEGEGHWTDVFAIVSCFISFTMFCFFGQGIINESEFLYHELMWSSWINKSKQYKNNLKFMMLCAKKPMEIKPAFYILNLNNVVKITHGTFSYFNVMRNLRMTKN